MAIHARNIRLLYMDGENQNVILDGIDIDIDNQKPTVFLGASGSGKSSLLYVLSRLRKPSEGQVFCDEEENKNSLCEDVRYNNFGFVFQHHFLIPYLNLFDNVMLARHDVKLKKETEEIMEKLGIMSIANKKPFEISGGERQRVAIARALVKKPKYIFADEPTASLDKSNANVIYSLLREYTPDCTLIMATHDTNLLRGDERVIHIEKGKLIY